MFNDKHEQFEKKLDLEKYFPQIKKYIEIGIEQAEKLADKEIFLCIGSTGAGKSTFVAHLSGAKLVEYTKGKKNVDYNKKQGYHLVLGQKKPENPEKGVLYLYEEHNDIKCFLINEQKEEKKFTLRKESLTENDWQINANTFEAIQLAIQDKFDCLSPCHEDSFFNVSSSKGYPKCLFPALGHNKVSRTFDMQYYKAQLSNNQEETPLFICDCPGFDDNRDINDSTTVAINFEVGIKKAKKINGLILVISIEDLEEKRLNRISSLASTLGQLLKDNIKGITKSIHVVFTNAKSDDVNSNCHLFLDKIDIKDYEKNIGSWVFSESEKEINYIETLDDAAATSIHDAIFEKFLIFIKKLSHTKIKSLVLSREESLEFSNLLCLNSLYNTIEDSLKLFRNKKDKQKNVLNGQDQCAYLFLDNVLKNSLKNDYFEIINYKHHDPLITINKIKKLHEIDKKLFCFDTYNEKRDSFCEFLASKIRESVVNIQDIIRDNELILRNKKNIKSVKNKIDDLAKCLRIGESPEKSNIDKIELERQKSQSIKEYQNKIMKIDHRMNYGLNEKDQLGYRLFFYKNTDNDFFNLLTKCVNTALLKNRINELNIGFPLLVFTVHKISANSKIYYHVIDKIDSKIRIVNLINIGNSKKPSAIVRNIFGKKNTRKMLVNNQDLVFINKEINYGNFPALANIDFDILKEKVIKENHYLFSLEECVPEDMKNGFIYFKKNEQRQLICSFISTTNELITNFIINGVMAPENFVLREINARKKDILAVLKVHIQESITLNSFVHFLEDECGINFDAIYKYGGLDFCKKSDELVTEEYKNKGEVKHRSYNVNKAMDIVHDDSENFPIAKVEILNMTGEVKYRSCNDELVETVHDNSDNAPIAKSETVNVDNYVITGIKESFSRGYFSAKFTSVSILKSIVNFFFTATVTVNIYVRYCDLYTTKMLSSILQYQLDENRRELIKLQDERNSAVKMKNAWEEWNFFLSDSNEYQKLVSLKSDYQVEMQTLKEEIKIVTKNLQKLEKNFELQFCIYLMKLTVLIQGKNELIQKLEQSIDDYKKMIERVNLISEKTLNIEDTELDKLDFPEEIIGLTNKSPQELIKENSELKGEVKRLKEQITCFIKQIALLKQNLSTEALAKITTEDNQLLLISNPKPNLSRTETDFFKEKKVVDLKATSSSISTTEWYTSDKLQKILNIKLAKNHLLQFASGKRFLCIGDPQHSNTLTCHHYRQQRFYVAIGDVTDVGCEGRGIDFLSLVGEPKDNVVYTVCDVLLTKKNIENQSIENLQNLFFMECRMQHNIEEQEILKMETYKAIKRCKNGLAVKELLQSVRKENRQATVFLELMPLITAENAVTSIARVIVPLNKGNRHWVNLELMLCYNKETKQLEIAILTHDPYGGGTLTEKEQNTLTQKLKTLINDQFNYDPKIVYAESAYQKRQQDGSSCGPIALEDTLLLALGQSLNRGLIPHGAPELRQEHADLLQQAERQKQPSDNVLN